MVGHLQKIIILSLVVATLSGCGAGRNAETRMIKQVTDGVEGQSNEIRLRNVLIVKNENSEGILVGTLVNWSDDLDMIIGITVNGAPITQSAPQYELLKNKPIIFAGESANADAFTTLTQVPGERVPIVFTFAKAAPVTLDALIVEDLEWYKGLPRYQPSPEPTPQLSNL
jgi:hypothetical protein